MLPRWKIPGWITFLIKYRQLWRCVIKVMLCFLVSLFWLITELERDEFFVPQVYTLASPWGWPSWNFTHLGKLDSVGYHIYWVNYDKLRCFETKNRQKKCYITFAFCIAMVCWRMIKIRHDWSQSFCCNDPFPWPHFFECLVPQCSVFLDPEMSYTDNIALMRMAHTHHYV